MTVAEKVSCVVDSVNRREGETIIVPMETSIFEYDGRIVKV